MPAMTNLARATCGTMRTPLLSIGLVVRVTVRRVWVDLSSANPLAALVEVAADRLRQALAG